MFLGLEFRVQAAGFMMTWHAAKNHPRDQRAGHGAAMTSYLPCLKSAHALELLFLELQQQTALALCGLWGGQCFVSRNGIRLNTGGYTTWYRSLVPSSVTAAVVR